MKIFQGLFYFIVCFLLFLPKTAFAHVVNAKVDVFYAGILHPLTSFEHLFPTVALALVASQCGRREKRISLFAFPAALLVGLLIGRSFPEFYLAHPTSLVLLMLLGGLLIKSRWINITVVTTSVLATGLILGYRSGLDMSNANAGLKFIPGVVLTGFFVIAIITEWIPKATTRMEKLLRTLGGICFSLAGTFFLMKWFLAVDTSIIGNIGLPTEESLTAMVKVQHLTLPVTISSLLGAAAWGAAHSLTPGHGKAIVAAYLVGEKGTPWHAVYLGLTVTVTHTLGVYFLGVITLFASNYILADQLYPWLGAISGIIIMVLAIYMMAARFRPIFFHEKDHHALHLHGHHHSHTGHHHHHHLPANGAPANWKSILGLGISGGLLPCPSALVLLLTAVAFQRAGFGIILVAAFSIGMAAVLMAVGLLFVKGNRLISGSHSISWIGRYLPIASALIILFLGLILTYDSIGKIKVQPRFSGPQLQIFSSLPGLAAGDKENCLIHNIIKKKRLLYA